MFNENVFLACVCLEIFYNNFHKTLSIESGLSLTIIETLTGIKHCILEYIFHFFHDTMANTDT